MHDADMAKIITTENSSGLRSVTIPGYYPAVGTAIVGTVVLGSTFAFMANGADVSQDPEYDISTGHEVQNSYIAVNPTDAWGWTYSGKYFSCWKNIDGTLTVYPGQTLPVDGTFYAIWQDGYILYTKGKFLVSDIRIVISVPVQLITFYVESTSYQAESGMTWAQFCTSKYNVDNFLALKWVNGLNNAPIRYSYEYGKHERVIPEYVIVAGEHYIY